MGCLADPGSIPGASTNEMNSNLLPQRGSVFFIFGTRTWIDLSLQRAAPVARVDELPACYSGI
jgi:hypothetical protein